MLKVLVAYFWYSFGLFFAGIKTHEWQRGTTMVPKWVCTVLLLPYNKTGEIPIYLIVVKVIMQVATLVIVVLYLMRRCGNAEINGYLIMIVIVTLILIPGWIYCGR